jgi:hypothetical protein
MAAFPPLQPTDVVVEGDSWKGSSKDVAIAGAAALMRGAEALLEACWCCCC